VTGEFRVTGSLIEQARQFHDLVRRNFRPLTERELVERMLLFANDDSDETIVQAAAVAGNAFLVGTYAPPEFDDEVLDFRRATPQVMESARQWWRSISRERKHWRKAIQIIVNGTRKDRDHLTEWALRTRDDTLVLVPHLRAGTIAPEIRYLTDSVEAACAHVALLLLDPKTARSLGGTVRHCALEGCTNVLLSAAAKGGGPRTRFCSNVHKKEFLRLRNNERQKRKRERDRRADDDARRHK
jgi:hypothetical protein